MIGYGFLIAKFLEINKYNFGFLGLIGITFFGFFSYFSSLFVKHNYFFNSIFIIIGFLIFIFSIKKFPHIKKNY